MARHVTESPARSEIESFPIVFPDVRWQAIAAPELLAPNSSRNGEQPRPKWKVGAVGLSRPVKPHERGLDQIVGHCGVAK
jgi:hypothetical protein